MYIIDKKYKRLKKAALAALLMLGSHASAQDLVLVSGTDFTPKSDEGKPFYSWADVEKGDIGFQGIIKPQVKINVPLCESIKFDTKSSDFIDGHYYCITNNPCKIDSFRFYDTKEAEWGILLPKGTSTGASTETFMTYKVNGLAIGSKFRVEVDYCFVAEYSKEYSTGYPGVIYSVPSQKIEFGAIDPRIKFIVNPDIYSQADGVSQGFSIANKLERGCETAVITNTTTTYGAVSGELQLNINSTVQTAAIFIKAIRVYAELQPKISGTREFCVGGDKGTIKADIEYRGAKYQWYKDGKAIPGETGPSTVHTSGTEIGIHKYYYEMTIENAEEDKITLKSNTFEVNDIVCCQNEDGLPMSRKMIYKQDFGTFTSDEGKEFYIWDYSDLTDPKKVFYTTTTPFRTNLPAIGENAPEGANETNINSADSHSMVAWISDADGSALGWAAMCDNGQYWGPGRANGPFFPDHTDQLEGTGKYGAALFVNAKKGDYSKSPYLIYKHEIKGICENSNLTVKCYINSFSDGSNPVRVGIRAYDSNLPNNVFESKIIVRDATGKDSGWKEVSVDIPMVESGDLTFEILDFSENSDDMGDDLIVDDILVYTCSAPKVDLSFDETLYITDTTTCTGDEISPFVQESPMMSIYGANSKYLYQYNLKNPEDTKKFNESWNFLDPVNVEGKSYENLGSVIENLIYDLSNEDNSIYFRVIAGNESIINDIKHINEMCSSYSISDPIKLTINCPICTTPKDIKIKADKAASTEKKNGKDVIELNFGDSVTLSQVSDITPDQSEWGTPDFGIEGFAIKWFESESTVNMSGAELILNSTISDKIIKFDDHSLEGTIMPVTLHAVDAIYPDGGCKTSDIVYIKFNISTKVDAITTDDDEITNVYTISGALVKSNVKRSEALNGLANGAYVVGNETIIINK